MDNVQIGDIVTLKATVVDYNEKEGKVKVRIAGYEEDKKTSVERYIWLDYNNPYTGMKNCQKWKPYWQS